LSVALEFIHLFIPMRLIDEQFSGGWPEWKRLNRNLIGGSAWFDELLYTQCAMNGLDIDSFAADWKKSFPELFPGLSGRERHWHTGVTEYLVANGGPQDWCQTASGCAWYGGEEPGEEIFRSSIEQTERWQHPENFPARIPMPEVS
jgi:hypothetical protein